MIAGLTCLWDRGATKSMINRKHTKYYKRKMQSNKVECVTSVGLYCTTHGVKLNFFMLELSIRKKIEHRFHADRDKGKLGIGYDMIIGCDLMVQLSL